MTQAQSTAKKPKIESTRNAEKHPLCTVDARGTGLMKNGVLGIYFHRTQADFKNTGITTFGKKGANTPANATKAHPKLKPAIPPSMKKVGEALSTEHLKKLQDLIDFTEKQVELDYTEAKEHKDVGVTNYIVDQYVKEGKFGTAKASSLSKSMCLAYVKVALYQKDYINGISGTGPAKESVNDWGQYDYTDVSADLPKVEISYIPKSGSTLPKDTKLEQPDLIHTLPGDLIIYEQVDPVDAAAPGHIDIRTYHHYMSDFTRGHPLPALGVGSGKHYKVTGVYRKISDTMAMVRVEAFLRLIREHVAGETSLKDKERSYQLKQYDKSAKDPFADLNKDLKTHPTEIGGKNIRAGAYQIDWVAFSRVHDKTGWPKSFTSEMQDRVAMYLLQEQPKKTVPHPRRSALGYIMENKLDEAVKLIMQENELAHWPGGNKNPVDPTLKTTFENYVNEAAIEALKK